VGCRCVRSVAMLAVLMSGTTLQAQRVIVDTPDRGAVFGEPFELSVLRAWPRDHDPQPFDPAELAPLELREIEVSMVASGAELIERRRFEAVVFEAGEIVFAPYELRTRDPGGREHVAEFAVDALMVRSSLPEPPGGIEWPGDVRELQKARIWPLVVAALALLGLSGLGLLRKLRPAVAPPVVPVGPTAAELARQEIDALELPGSDRERLEAYYLALAVVVRRFAKRRLGVRAFVFTSEELIAVVPVGGDPLQQCLFACDLVKFAAARPEQAADAEARARALAFVDANERTAGPEAVS